MKLKEAINNFEKKDVYVICINDKEMASYPSKDQLFESHYKDNEVESISFFSGWEIEGIKINIKK